MRYGTDGRAVFMSVAAQEDNLGDVLIRRNCLSLILRPKDVLFANVGDMSASYLGAVLPPEGEVVADRWPGLFVTYMRHPRRPVLVIAPGPHTLPQRMPDVARSLVRGLVAVLIRALGGDVLVVGRAIRRGRRGFVLGEQILCLASTLYTVRDRASAELLGSRLKSRVHELPDLGFWQGAAKGSSAKVACEPEPASTLCVSLRADRGVKLGQLIDVLREVSREANLLLVSQVRRDDSIHRQLAEELGAEAILWESRSHREQEARVVAAYARSRWILSNRLHALIMASSQGAFPISLELPEHDKIGPTLDGRVLFVRMMLGREHADEWKRIKEAAAANPLLMTLEEIAAASREVGQFWRAASAEALR